MATWKLRWNKKSKNMSETHTQRNKWPSWKSSIIWKFSNCYFSKNPNTKARFQNDALISIRDWLMLREHGFYWLINKFILYELLIDKIAPFWNRRYWFYSGLNRTCPLVGGAYNDYFKTYSLIMKLIIHIIIYFFKIFMILILYRIKFVSSKT